MLLVFYNSMICDPRIKRLSVVSIREEKISDQCFCTFWDPVVPLGLILEPQNYSLRKTIFGYKLQQPCQFYKVGFMKQTNEKNWIVDAIVEGSLIQQI